MDPLFIPIPAGDSGSTASPSTAQLDDARRDVSNVREAMATLKRQVDKQGSLLRALFAMLGERHGFTEAELLARFQTIEAAQREPHPVIACSECGRPISLQHNRCLYCGTARQVESAFDLL
jgi:hypothetical protein